MDGVQRGQGGVRPKVTPLPSAEEAQHASRGVTSTPSGAASGVNSAPATQKVDKAQEPPKIKEESRVLSKEDLSQLAVKMQRPVNKFTLNVLSTLLSHGAPASLENVVNVENMVKGRKGKAVDAAVIALVKGLGSSSKGVDALLHFFANNAKLAQQLQKFQGSSKAFLNALNTNKSLINSGLLAGLSAIIAEFDEDIKKHLRKSKDDQLNLPKAKTEGLFKGVKTFNGFLNGLQQGFDKFFPIGKANVGAFKGVFEQLKRDVNDVLITIVSQSILSKEMAHAHQGVDNFSYWQIPNPMTQAASNIDILISKDPKENSKAIDPKSTKIVLKFDTPDLGEIAVVIDIKDNSLKYVFSTASGETKTLIAEMTPDLQERMTGLNYEITQLQVKKQKVDITKLLIPTFNLDTMTRIVAEA